MPHPIDIYVGLRVRARRNSFGMSQTDLSEALGLTFQQVQKYETGGNRISCSRLYMIAEVLNVTPGYFFEDMPDGIKKGPGVDVKSIAISNLTKQMSSRETLEIIKAMGLIKDKATRHSIANLARAIGKSRQGK